MGIEAPLLERTLGGRFKIMGHIGDGAMASVFRGVDLKRPADGEVAVKIMHPHLASDRTFTARFKREAQAASMVKHPASVAILDVGEEAGVHYIIMELCPGRDLRETLKAERRLTEPRAVRIIITICDALNAAHQLGVVHRDLKPENVMILHDPATGTDTVKVLDFGIAKLVDAQPKVRINGTDSDPPPALTQFGVVVGTPQYMSPEQCRGQPLDGRSDLYTCGILLYQLVTGALPFNSESPFEVAGKQAFEPPPPPRTHFPEIDQELESIILRTLSKSADERPQSATDLIDILKRWLDSKGGERARALAQGAPGLPDRRGGPPPRPSFGNTQPLADRSGQTPGKAADEILAREGSGPRPSPAAGAPPRGMGGPFVASGGGGAAREPPPRDQPPAAPFPPSPYEQQGAFGTIVAMDAVTAPADPRPPPPRPAAGVAASQPQQNLSPPGGFDVPKIGMNDHRGSFDAIDPGLVPPQGIGGIEPQPSFGPSPGNASAAPGFDAMAAPPPTVSDPAAHQQPKTGWGVIGVLAILLSLLAGVGLGVGLYRLAPF